MRALRPAPYSGPAASPAIAWEISRLSTRREWLDHLVTDRFFSREELERSCETLFPGCRLDVPGGPRGIGLVWDALLTPPARVTGEFLAGSGWPPDAENVVGQPD